MANKLSDAERFWARVDKSGECWLWKTTRDACGYGRFYVGPHYEQAHRFAFALYSGEAVPPGLYVLHRCDNPPCVKDEHLFLGTNLDNIKDMESKGRKRVRPPRGGRAHNAKLTWDDVLEIRRRHPKVGPGEKLIGVRATGREFGINHSSIRAIVDGKRWPYPPEEWTPPVLPPLEPHWRKFLPELAKEIPE